MIRPGPEKHGVWPNLSLDNALLILGSDRIMTMDKNNFPAVFSASRLKDGNKETGQPSFLD